jgi:thiamine biosynthesis lipoprotein
MGTVVSLDLRQQNQASQQVQVALEAAIQLLHHLDRTLTTWDESSPLQRWRRGEIALDQAPVEVAESVRLAQDAARRTGGAFDPNHAGQVGWGPDPTGLVKGWAAHLVSERLAAHGVVDHLVNAAGDLVGLGLADGEPWSVGVAHPLRPGLLVSVVRGPADGVRFAVATSGPAERGGHVMDPRTGAAAHALASATVVGSDGAWCDALATAAVALGRDSPSLLSDVAALLVHDDGSTWTSPRWEWAVSHEGIAPVG